MVRLPVGGSPCSISLRQTLGRRCSLFRLWGFEVGSGFAGVAMTGSQHNDAFYKSEDGTVRTKTNHSGGIQGGITNGEPIIMRAAFKPTATIIQDQDSVNEENEEVTFKAKGRHDPCVVPRAVPICEAMAALVLIDHALRQRAQGGLGEV